MHQVIMMNAIEISGIRKSYSSCLHVNNSKNDKLVIPGTIISKSGSYMRGHGTYTVENDLIASVAGVVEQVNKLISVQPLKSRYNGRVGDVVIGRVVEVQQNRWRVDANARLTSTLLLSSVNLPGGELRRKSMEDSLLMREYLKEGDLISAEVQKVQLDGQLQLHTRNLRYGKLFMGTLVKVSPYLIKRRKTHFHTFPYGISVILGCNGNIWISPVLSEEHNSTGGYVENLDENISLEIRMAIARTTNCVNILANYGIQLYDTTIISAYEVSKDYEVKELLKVDISQKVAECIADELSREEMDT